MNEWYAIHNYHACIRSLSCVILLFCWINRSSFLLPSQTEILSEERGRLWPSMAKHRQCIDINVGNITLINIHNPKFTSVQRLIISFVKTLTLQNGEYLLNKLLFVYHQMFIFNLIILFVIMCKSPFSPSFEGNITYWVE